MPPVSKAQARFLWAKKPKLAKKWAGEGAMSIKGLPDHVAPRAPTVEAHKIRGQATFRRMK